MRRGRIVLIGVVLLFISIQTVNAQKEKYHSIFIYNFSKYIKWPENSIKDKFVIGVIGDSPINDQLASMVSAKKKVNGMSFELQKYNAVSEIGDCHILYIPTGKSNELGSFSPTFQNKPVLIVTDKPGLTEQGAVINFVEMDGKIRFELNQTNAESRGLMVAASLVSLAIIK